MAGDASKFFISSTVRVDRREYREEFEPSVFLKYYYHANRQSDIAQYLKFRLQCYHESFLTQPSGIKVLDYGAGPVIASTISASTKASEIVLADYCQENLDLLNKWLNCKPDMFNWSPYFSYVVQELEEKQQSLVQVREGLVRQLVKAVVHCNITQDPPIAPDYNGFYDVVMCSLVVEGVSATPDEYCSNIAQLGKLVKPGGYIFYHGVENTNGYYTVGFKSFPNLQVSDELTVSAFTKAGFEDITLKHNPHKYPGVTFRFVVAKRN